jgi:hypothetical protein
MFQAAWVLLCNIKKNYKTQYSATMKNMKVKICAKPTQKGWNVFCNACFLGSLGWFACGVGRQGGIK